jgi:hypothetical protein
MEKGRPIDAKKVDNYRGRMRFPLGSKRSLVVPTAYKVEPYGLPQTIVFRLSFQ